MCFFLFPRVPKKRRYYPTESSEEELIPRKRRATQYSARPAKYEPLRGHGVKRDPVKVPAGVLRGQGAKREPQQQLKRPSPVEPQPRLSSKSLKSTPSKRRVEQTPTKRPSANNSQKRRSESFSRSPREHHHATPEMAQVSQYQQLPQPSTSHYRYSYPTSQAREHPLYTNQTPKYVYSMPRCYYHDIGAVRAATSHALQESMFDATRFEANRAAYSKSLRRQPAYQQLRY